MFYNVVCYSPGSLGKESNILLHLLLLLNRRERVKDWIGGTSVWFDCNLFVFLFAVTDFAVAMGGGIVASGPDDPAPARHSGGCDGAAVERRPMDRLRRKTARQVASLFGSLPHPQRAGPPMVLVFHGAAHPRGGGCPGRVLHCLHRLFAFLPPQDPLPIQPPTVQFFETGIPPQVRRRK